MIIEESIRLELTNDKIGKGDPFERIQRKALGNCEEYVWESIILLNTYQINNLIIIIRTKQYMTGFSSIGKLEREMNQMTGGNKSRNLI